MVAPVVASSFWIDFHYGARRVARVTGSVDGSAVVCGSSPGSVVEVVVVVGATVVVVLAGAGGGCEVAGPGDDPAHPAKASPIRNTTTAMAPSATKRLRR